MTHLVTHNALPVSPKHVEQVVLTLAGRAEQQDPRFDAWWQRKRGVLYDVVHIALVGVKRQRSVDPTSVLDKIDEALRVPPGFVYAGGTVDVHPDGAYYSYDAQGFVQDAGPWTEKGLIRRGEQGFEAALDAWFDVATRFADGVAVGKWTGSPRFRGAPKGWTAPGMPVTSTLGGGVYKGVSYATNGHMLIPAPFPEMDTDSNRLDLSVKMFENVLPKNTRPANIVAITWPGNPRRNLASVVLEAGGALAIANPVLLFVAAVACGAKTWQQGHYAFNTAEALPGLGGVVDTKGAIAVGSAIVMPRGPDDFDNAAIYHKIVVKEAKRAAERAQEVAKAEAKAAHKRRLEDPTYAKQAAFDALIGKLKNKAWLDDVLVGRERRRGPYAPVAPGPTGGVHHVAVAGWKGPGGTIPDGRVYITESVLYPTNSVGDLLYLISRGVPVDARFPQRLLDKVPDTIVINVLGGGKRDVQAARREDIEAQIRQHEKAIEKVRESYDPWGSGPLGSGRGANLEKASASTRP